MYVYGLTKSKADRVPCAVTQGKKESTYAVTESDVKGGRGKPGNLSQRDGLTFVT